MEYLNQNLRHNNLEPVAKLIPETYIANSIADYVQGIPVLRQTKKLFSQYNGASRIWIPSANYSLEDDKHMLSDLSNDGIEVSLTRKIKRMLEEGERYNFIELRHWPNAIPDLMDCYPHDKSKPIRMRFSVKGIVQLLNDSDISAA